MDDVSRITLNKVTDNEKFPPFEVGDVVYMSVDGGKLFRLVLSLEVNSKREADYTVLDLTGNLGEIPVDASWSALFYKKATPAEAEKYLEYVRIKNLASV